MDYLVARFSLRPAARGRGWARLRWQL